MEQTFILIKPDGVERGLAAEIIDRFEKKGFSLKGSKVITVDRFFAEMHYANLSAKPFFSDLVDSIISGPVVAMVWEGKGVLKTGRKIIEATNPSASDTIRGDYVFDIGSSVIHGSDSVKSARKEIALWFPDGCSKGQNSLHSQIYVKFDGARSEEQSNTLPLLLAVLIASVTFVAVLRLPGRVWLSSNNKTYSVMVLVINSFWFFTSLRKINLLIYGFRLRFELQICLLSLILAYVSCFMAQLFRIL